MTERDYKELNTYLNGCFIELEKSTPFLVDNLFSWVILSKQIENRLKQYELVNSAIENKLSFDEVYQKAREIVESISPKYLVYFDKLIESGKLDFGYENEYHDSNLFCNSEKDIYLININRNFTYGDIINLIHEFMHYINGHSASGCISMNRDMFTEFISIYFEQYALRFLQMEGIPKEELNLNSRFIDTKNLASEVSYYYLILFTYFEIGPIDENSYNFIIEHCFPSAEEKKFLNELQISKEGYDRGCRYILEKFKKAEKEYRMSILYEEEFREENFYEKVAPVIGKTYRYILGTPLAFYALKYCDMDKMVYFNDHINDEAVAYTPPINLLNSIGIDLVNIGPEGFLDIMEDKIIENLDKKVFQ